MVNLKHRSNCRCNDCYINKRIFYGLISLFILLMSAIFFNTNKPSYCTGYTVIDSVTVVSCQGDTSKLYSLIK